jgi:hypothetical protein
VFWSISKPSLTGFKTDSSILALSLWLNASKITRFKNSLLGALEIEWLLL